MSACLRLNLGALALVLSCTFVACGDDDQAPTTPIKKPKDAGGEDSLPDGDVPQPRKDAGTSMVEPGMPDPGLKGQCAIDSNKIYTLIERTKPLTSTPLAVDPINSRFVLPYVASGNCLEAVNMSSLEGDANSGAPKDNVAIDECALVTNAVAAALNDGWLLATVDNRKAPYDVWIAPYDITRSKPGTAQRISQNSSVETGIAMTALRSGDSAMVAWTDESSGGQSLFVRPLDKTGTPSGDAVRLEQASSLYFQGLSIRALGADGAGLVYVRYSIDYATSDIVFVALDKTGKAVRDAWVISSSAGPSPSVDLAVDESGGGIVFARAEAQTGRQVWFQEIDDTGQAAVLRSGLARAPSLRVVNAPFKGVDVSIAKVSASYAIAYRALPAVNQDRAQIRLYFTDRFGAVIGDSDVSFTSPSGGRTAIAAAYDGRVVVGWSQVNEDGKSVTRVVRLPCVGG